MTKVLVIGPLPPPAGGMETILNQISFMRYKNIKIKIFNTSKKRIIKSLIVFNLLNFIYRSIKLTYILLFYRPDLLHIHTASSKSFWQNHIYFQICKIFNKKIILHIHGGAFKDFYTHSNKFIKARIIKTLNSADSLIVLSNYWFNFFKTLCPTQKIHILPNSIDLDIISKYNIKKSKKIDNKYNILFVGRIEKQKGIYELLNAFSEIKNKNLFLYIMGPFMNNEREIRTLTKKLKISNRVKFLGMISGPEKYEYFSKSHLFVLPSYWEGLPLSVLEAMSFGLPIIATDVGAIPEIIKKENGILIKPKNYNILKEKIITILKNKDRIDYYTNNISTVRKHFNFKNFRRKLRIIYETV